MIHPLLHVLAGGELLCLYVCKALQEEGYRVSLACDQFDPEAVSSVYGQAMRDVISLCNHIRIPGPFTPFFPLGTALQRVAYAQRVAHGAKKLVREMNPDIVFSTQSSIYPFTCPLYHFVYDLRDLFGYPESLRSTGLDSGRSYHKVLRLLRHTSLPLPSPTRFLALSGEVLRMLKNAGLGNSLLIYPPCETPFKPLTKKPSSVMLVARIVPTKRIEMFFEVAKRLPDYHFTLVGRDNPTLQKFNPGYSRNLLAHLPDNVHYEESPIRQVPWLVEEAKIYLHTEIQPGIGIALVEAMGAGCYPVVADQGGGAEVVSATGVGRLFRHDNVEAAVEAVRKGVPADVSPSSISECTHIFSPQVFMRRVRSFL